MPLFSIATFDERGPIKSWARLNATQVHNARSEPLAHCDPNGPPPVYLIGSANLVDDVKTKLRNCEIDGDSLRSNGVIGYEAILSASHDYFDGSSETERAERLGRWVRLTFKAAQAIWGAERIIQMVLHRDEYTPHIHVVLLPLVKKAYSRWPDRGTVWALNGRVIAGPGEYQRVQTEYAAALAPLGLERGLAGSNAKHRPYADEIKDLEAEKGKAADAALAATLAEQQAREAETKRVLLWMEQFDALQKREAEAKKRAQQIAEKEQQLSAEQDALRLAWADLALARSHAAAALESANTERRDACLDRIEAATERRDAERALDALQPTIEQALAFRAALLPLPLGELPPAAIEVLRSIRGFERAADLLQLPANDEAGLSVEAQRAMIGFRSGAHR